MVEFRRVAASGALAGQAVGFAVILAGSLLSPSFSWTASAISDLGVTPETALLFNAGLGLSALLALPFAGWLWTDAANRLQAVAAVTFAAGGVALAGVAAFPAGHPYHGPAAITYFLLFTYTLFLHGSGSVLAGRPVRGLAAVWLAVGHVTAWLVWAALPVSGIALPEFAGALAFAGWLVTTARDALRRPR